MQHFNAVGVISSTITVHKNADSDDLYTFSIQCNDKGIFSTTENARNSIYLNCRAFGILGKRLEERTDRGCLIQIDGEVNVISRHTKDLRSLWEYHVVIRKASLLISSPTLDEQYRKYAVYSNTTLEPYQLKKRNTL